MIPLGRDRGAQAEQQKPIEKQLRPPQPNERHQLLSVQARGRTADRVDDIHQSFLRYMLHKLTIRDQAARSWILSPSRSGRRAAAVKA